MTETITERALLAAIIANPDDDQPRLAYADWLEENGQTERAEFIRVQIELANATSGRSHRVWSNEKTLDQAVRAASIFTEHGERWFGKFATITPPNAREANGQWWIVERGFISEIRCTEEQWVGGECERCEGRGQVQFHDGQPITPRSGNPFVVQCPACHGTGHIVGIGQRIAQTHPVERVVTEKRPWKLMSDDWIWWLDDGSTDDIPSSVRRELHGHIKTPRIDQFGYWKSFESEQAALDAYSRAAIEWARRPQTVTATFHYAGELQPMPMDDIENETDT